MEREVSEVDRKLLLKKNYLDKIHYYTARNPIDQDELYIFIRKFFSEYLKLDYEFTYEELSQELNKVFIKPKVKEHIDGFLIRLSESEYLEEASLGTVEINEYLKELDDIIRNVIFDDQPVVEESPTLIQKVLKIKHSEQEKVMDISGVASLIDEINFHITNGNINTAKNSYVELSKLYDKLSKDDKKKLHDDMNEVYERLQTLIKNPKSLAATNKENVSESIKKVTDFVEETLFYINASNINSAKKSYSEALQAYEILNPTEKKLMHARVSDLYAQMQVLSTRQKTTSSELSTKGLAEINGNISVDLPEMEPISEDGNLLIPEPSSASTSSTTSASVSTLTSSNISEVSTANFVENFGKSVASSSLVFPNDVIDTNTNNSTGVSNANNSINTKSFDFSAPIDNSNTANNNVISSDFFNSLEKDNSVKGSFANDIDIGILEKKSNVENVLFTASSSDVPENKDSVTHIKKSVVKTFTVVKPVVSQPIKPIMESVTPILAPSIITPSTITPSTINPLTSKIDNKIINPVVSPVSVSTKINPIIAPVVNDSTAISKVKNPVLNPIITSIDIPAVSEIKKPSVLETSPNTINDVSSISTSLSVPVSISTTNSSKINSTSISLPVEKLTNLLKKIDDDIISGKLEKAKEIYKDALLIYRPLRDSEKAKCYVHFYDTFKRLDDALHQKSLQSILDEHLSESTKSHRPIASTPLINSEKYISESQNIIKKTTLPVILSNDQETTRVYELIEESYFNITNSNADLAMLKYFKALEFYHKLPMTDKKKAYSDLYRLFQKLSIVKKVYL